MAGRGKLRFPAIVTPATGAQDVKVAIGQIRERLEAIEDDLTASTAQSQASITALQTTVTSTGTTATATGTVQTFGALTPISGNIAVAMVGNEVVAAVDPTSATTAFGCIGVSQGAAAAGKISVALAGSVIAVPLGFLPFTPIFAGAAGVLTQSPPATPAVIQVGVALSPGLMLVAPAPTLLASTNLLGSPGDDLLGITRNPGTTWQFNGVQVAVRRIADFVAGAGFTMSMQDDPGNNRVVITFGTTLATISGLTLQDEWDLLADDQVEDAWEEWADDSQANSSTVTPSPNLSLEDGWVDPDDTADEWDLLVAAGGEILPASLPSRINAIEDAWDWAYDDVVEDWETWQFDSRANDSTVVGSANLSTEDGWIDQDDTEDDLWIRIAATTTGFNQNG